MFVHCSAMRQQYVSDMSVSMQFDGHMSTNETPWMETEEVAAYAKVPTDTVRAWRFRGVGPVGHRVGRHVRYHIADVDAWMRSGDTGRGGDPRGGAAA